ncbi:MAG: hypothetical protein MEPRV_00321 [Providencia sp.]
MSSNTHNEHYIQKINHTIRKSLLTYNRVTAIRVDLRFPSSNILYLDDSNVITRFFESLKAKINADLKRKKKHGNVTIHAHYFMYGSGSSVR